MSDSLQILPLIMDASPVVKGVMAVLVVLSLLGWLIIFRLMGKVSSSVREDADFEEWFWGGDNLSRQYNEVMHNGDKDGLAEVFFVGYQEFVKLQKLSPNKDDITGGVERKLRVALGKQQSYLESGLPTLASIASVSPYIGLFGTVWGIMSAFIGLGQAESVSLATVAPSIAEALIATAMGLFAAIPASLAFNHFSAKANTLYENRSLFCDELTGAMVREFLTHKGQA